MGSIARQERCERFMAEFGGDALRAYGAEAPWIKAQSVGYDSYNGEVRLYATLALPDGKEAEVIFSDVPIFYEGELGYTPEEVAEILGLDVTEVRNRMIRADLIDADDEPTSGKHLATIIYACAHCEEKYPVKDAVVTITECAQCGSKDIGLVIP